MAGRRKKNEGCYGKKTIKGVTYNFYRFPTQNGVEGKYVYAKTMKELQEKIKKIKEQEEGDDYLINSKGMLLTVGDYAERWLIAKKQTIKPKTYDGYEFNVSIIQNKQFILGCMQIRKVKKKQIQDFFDELTEYYARNTILKTRTILNEIFDEAVEERLIERNPVSKTKVPLEENIKKKTREIVILEKDDIEKFIKEAESINGDGSHMPSGKLGTPVYGIAAKMAVFILNTGLRASEAVGLRWDCVDMQDKIIKVKRSDTYIKDRDKNSEKKYKLQTGTPKSQKGFRTIPLSNKAIEILEFCKENQKNEYVFTTKNGNRVLQSNLDKTIKRILKNGNCKINSCGAHALRHTFASQLIAEGVEIQVISKLLGHSKVSTTYDIYIHLLEKQDEKAIQALNNIF